MKTDKNIIVMKHLWYIIYTFDIYNGKFNNYIVNLPKKSALILH